MGSYLGSASGSEWFGLYMSPSSHFLVVWGLSPAIWLRPPGTSTPMVSVDVTPPLNAATRALGALNASGNLHFNGSHAMALPATSSALARLPMADFSDGFASNNTSATSMTAASPPTPLSTQLYRGITGGLAPHPLKVFASLMVLLEPEEPPLPILTCFTIGLWPPPSITTIPAPHIRVLSLQASGPAPMAISPPLATTTSL